MNMRRDVVVVLAGLACLAGCTSPEVRTHIDSVNSEYRQLEDYVYCLEDENARLQRTLKNVQENYQRVLRGEPPQRGGPFRRNASDSAGAETNEQPPTIEVPGRSTSTPPPTNRSTLQRPKLESSPAGSDESIRGGEPEPPTIEFPAPGTDAPATDDLPTPAIPRTSTPAQPETLPTPPADTKVTHLFLNPLLTGGADFDRQPGDEGLTVVVEPRNAADEYVPQAGAISVVVLDPSRQDETARIARWDFTLSATQQKLQTASAAPGIQLEMPWPASAPTANQLKLYVRYETVDGRRLQTERDIYITPPGQVAQRWTPRPADRPRAETAPGIAAVPPAPAKRSSIVQPPPAAAASEAAGAVPTIAAPPKLLAPPPALSGESGVKPSAPVWSPNR